MFKLSDAAQHRCYIYICDICEYANEPYPFRLLGKQFPSAQNNKIKLKMISLSTIYHSNMVCYAHLAFTNFSFICQLYRIIFDELQADCNNHAATVEVVFQKKMDVVTYATFITQQLIFIKYAHGGKP